MNKKAQIAERQSKIVLYRHLGLNPTVMASLLGVDTRTIRRDLAAIREVEQDQPKPEFDADPYEAAIVAIAPEVAQGDREWGLVALDDVVGVIEEE